MLNKYNQELITLKQYKYINSLLNHTGKGISPYWTEKITKENAHEILGKLVSKKKEKGLLYECDIQVIFDKCEFAPSKLGWWQSKEFIKENESN